MEEIGINEAITPSVVERLSVVPSERGLVGVEVELIGKSNREYILKKQVDKIREQYDFILIDCPP